ncbi:MAG: hypothetical protein Q9205_000982 [Flavoplaca limonia]
MLPVPKIEFGSFKYAARLARYGDPWYLWSGPSQAIQYMASRVMVAGEVLPVTPPASNATWKLHFWGPALQCNDVPETKSDEIFTNMWNAIDIIDTNPTFLSWVPWSPADFAAPENFTRISNVHTPYLPFLDFVEAQSNSGDGGNATTSRSNMMGPPPSSLSTPGPLSLFVAVLPGFVDVRVDHEWPKVDYIPTPPVEHTHCDYGTIKHVSDALANCSTLDDTTPRENLAAIAVQDATLLQCDLVNTSYSLEFEYLNGQQVIRSTMGTSLPLNGSAHFLGPNVYDVESCGAFRADPFVEFSWGDGNPNIVDCGVDLSALRLLSYQGIMAAFNQLIVGSAGMKYSFPDGYKESNTTILRTVLADTKELAFLGNWADTTGTFSGLQDRIDQNTAKELQGLTGEKPLGTRGALKSTLEELFQNLTISLLAEPYFKPNNSSIFAPEELANVTLRTYQNIYIYDRTTLWIAYGLSLLFSTLAAIVGLIAVNLSGASYSNQFSTIMRVAKTGELNVDLGDQRYDGFGRDPLPKHLKHARLDMRDHSGHADHDIPLEEGHSGDQSPRADDAKKDTGTQETSEVQSLEQEGLMAASGEKRAAASMHHQSVSPINEEVESDVPEIRDWQLWQRENGDMRGISDGIRGRGRAWNKSLIESCWSVAYPVRAFDSEGLTSK